MFENGDWLNHVWFVLVGVLFTGYAILDGFDLGVGILHCLAKRDEDRRVFLNAIGPVWDGNEVWLVTAGGALFAAFPEVYATLLSGLYLPIIVLLLSLIFRAVAIEFRSKHASRRWRDIWDASFSLGSLGACFLLGLTVGNLAWGIPLSENGEMHLRLIDLLHPYAILIAVTTVALFTMHGAIYLYLKTEGELQEQVRGWIRPAIIAFVLCYVAATMATLLYVPHLAQPFRDRPWLFGLALLSMLVIANIPRLIFHRREFAAFLSSAGAIASLFALFALGLYPNLIVNRLDPEKSWNLYNAASSTKTLSILLMVAGLGIPVVISYTACIYWAFRGKVKMSKTSY